MKPFPVVHFEISGICNGRCPYCASGSRNQPQGGFVDIGIFREVLDKLTDTGLADKKHSTLALYNWGEPFLHPRIDDIIDVINDYEFKYAFSTNASVFPTINKAFTKNLKLAMISMPGFSQESYDRIHGFDFAEIKENIKELVVTLKQHGYVGEIRLSYHVYQFNLDEMIWCEAFCKSIGANFFPYYATLLDWWQLMDYINNRLPIEKFKAMARDVFMNFVDEGLKTGSQVNTCTLINDYLIINENGTIATCCNLPTNHPDYSCGNLLQDDIKEVLRNKASKPVCLECMNLGIASDPIRIPTFYYLLSRRSSQNYSARKTGSE